MSSCELCPPFLSTWDQAIVVNFLHWSFAIYFSNLLKLALKLDKEKNPTIIIIIWNYHIEELLHTENTFPNGTNGTTVTLAMLQRLLWTRKKKEGRFSEKSLVACFPTVLYISDLMKKDYFIVTIWNILFNYSRTNVFFQYDSDSINLHLYNIMDLNTYKHSVPLFRFQFYLFRFNLLDMMDSGQRKQKQFLDYCIKCLLKYNALLANHHKFCLLSQCKALQCNALQGSLYATACRGTMNSLLAPVHLMCVPLEDPHCNKL